MRSDSHAMISTSTPHVNGYYLIADNADACPDYVAKVREAGSGYMSIPFDEDVELTLKL